MKRIHISFIITIFFISFSTSNAFIENRYQWWKIRLDNLQNEKISVQKNNKIDSSVITLIDNEIDQAKNIISIFESNIKNDGSLTHVNRKYTQLEISDAVAQNISPIFDLYYLETLVNDSGNNNITLTRDLVKRQLNEIIEKRFGREGGKITEQIMDEEISQNDWKNLSMETFIGSMMIGKDVLLDKVKRAVINDLLGQLKRRNYITNGKELKTLTIETILQYFSSNSIMNELKLSQEALDSSWCWKGIYKKIDANFTHYEKIISMLNNTGTISLTKIKYYYNNISELESAVFTPLFSKYYFNKIFKPDRSNDEKDKIIMDIPSDISMRPVLLEIDTLRKETVLYIDGKEGEDFFIDQEKKCNSIIVKYMGNIKNKFSKEEERIDQLKEKENDSIIIANENEFNEAKKIFDQKLNNAYGYRNKTIEFLTWASNTKKIDNDGIIKSYKYHVKRDKEYLDFVKQLIKGSSNISKIDNTIIQKQYIISIRRSQNIFNFIGYSLSLEKKYLSSLSTEQIRTIKNMKAEFNKIIKSIRNDISKYYNDYAINRQQINKNIKESSEDIKEKIAQHEINILFQNAEEYAKFYNKFNYAEDAFEHYLETFNKFQKETSSGALSISLENSIKKRSLFTSINNFDENRIINEFRTKSYLKRQTEISIARLVSLLNFYKRKKIEIKDSPSASEINELKKITNKNPQVKIAEWKMNESNFTEIDQKAVKKLALIINKKIWDSKRTVQKNNETKKVTIQINEETMSLQLPKEWEEGELTNSDKLRGIIKVYHNIDKESTINLVKVSLKNSDSTNEASVKDISEKWITRSGNKMVKEKWGKKDKNEFFWILAKDDNKNIHESYTITKNGYAFIISGKTTKNKYKYFNRKLNSIFTSLEY